MSDVWTPPRPATPRLLNRHRINPEIKHKIKLIITAEITPKRCLRAGARLGRVRDWVWVGVWGRVSDLPTTLLPCPTLAVLLCPDPGALAAVVEDGAGDLRHLHRCLSPRSSMPARHRLVTTVRRAGDRKSVV